MSVVGCLFWVRAALFVYAICLLCPHACTKPCTYFGRGIACTRAATSPLGQWSDVLSRSEPVPGVLRLGLNTLPWITKNHCFTAHPGRHHIQTIANWETPRCECLHACTYRRSITLQQWRRRRTGKTQWFILNISRQDLMKCLLSRRFSSTSVLSTSTTISLQSDRMIMMANMHSSEAFLSCRPNGHD